MPVVASVADAVVLTFSSPFTNDRNAVDEVTALTRTVEVAGLGGMFADAYAFKNCAANT